MFIVQPQPTVHGRRTIRGWLMPDREARATRVERRVETLDWKADGSRVLSARFHTMLIALLALMMATGCTSASEERKKAVETGLQHLQLASGYFADKQIPQSIRELTLALEADPKNPDAHHLLGFIYMGRRNYPEAIRHLKQAVELRDDFYIAINNLGSAYIASGRWEEARPLYEELISKPTYNTPELAYNNLGWVQYNTGDYRSARDSLEMAIFLKPSLCLAHNNLGLVHVKEGNMVGARRSFQRAIKRCPTFVEPHFHIAQVMRTRGDPMARAYFQRCFELAAD
ncbi:MAG: tetratricopeptide repeat protein, partial [Myxococcota bacterium]